METALAGTLLLLRNFFDQYEQDGWIRLWRGHAREDGELTAAEASVIIRTFAMEQIEGVVA